MTLMPLGNFSSKTVMPICLPTNVKFKDTSRPATVVGKGINSAPKRQSTPICWTDGNGPEMFQRCADKWVRSDKRDQKNEYDLYEDVWERSAGCEFNDPPSSLNEVCKHFHEKIKQLRKMHDETGDTKDFTEDFVKEFLLNDSV